MMFLLRAAFWLSVVILLLPADEQSGEDAPRVTAFAAIAAVGATVSDLSQFCTRQPDVCATGGAAFQVFAEKMIGAAEQLFDRFGGGTGEAGDDGTLTPDDAEPAWRDPDAEGQV